MVLREFFLREAADSLSAMRAAAAVEPPVIDRLIRSARVLRGSALLAGDDRVHGAAAALAASLAAAPVEQASLHARVVATIEDLEVLVAGVGDAPDLEARIRSTQSRWGGVRSPVPEPGADRTETGGSVAREVAAVAETMDAAVTAFQSNPRDRDWLATVLRSQRALLGSAQIEATPILAESLRAVEDLAVLIGQLDVPVKAEWLDIFRSARDVLRAAAALLDKGEVPAPVPALSRLRTLRDELLARYSGRDPELRGGADELELPES